MTEQNKTEGLTVIVIPAYQPDETLTYLADQIWTLGYQIIVVDDGSGSEYQRIFEKIEDIAVILHHEENRGKGAAIKTALSYIRKEIWDCEIIGIMDADGQHATEDMKKVVECAQNHRDALVLGVRKLGSMPWRSRMGNGITRLLFRLLTGTRITDTQTGLRAFGTELADAMLAVDGERYEYEMNVLMAMVKKKVPVEEVPIETIYHDKHNSCSHFHTFRDSFRIYKDILRFSMASASSFLLDYLMFAVFMLVLPHSAPYILIGNILARIASAIYNYQVNCMLVFHEKRRAKTAAEYFVLAGCILLLNSLILDGLVQIAHISVYPAKIMTECILFCISFLVQRCIIFQNRRWQQA